MELLPQLGILHLLGLLPYACYVTNKITQNYILLCIFNTIFVGNIVSILLLFENLAEVLFKQPSLLRH